MVSLGHNELKADIKTWVDNNIQQNTVAVIAYPFKYNLHISFIIPR